MDEAILFLAVSNGKLILEIFSVQLSLLDQQQHIKKFLVIHLPTDTDEL